MSADKFSPEMMAAIQQAVVVALRATAESKATTAEAPAPTKSSQSDDNAPEFEDVHEHQFYKNALTVDHLKRTWHYGNVNKRRDVLHALSSCIANIRVLIRVRVRGSNRKLSRWYLKDRGGT